MAGIHYTPAPNRRGSAPKAAEADIALKRLRREFHASWRRFNHMLAQAESQHGVYFPQSVRDREASFLDHLEAVVARMSKVPARSLAGVHAKAAVLTTVFEGPDDDPQHLLLKSLLSDLRSQSCTP